MKAQNFGHLVVQFHSLKYKEKVQLICGRSSALSRKKKNRTISSNNSYSKKKDLLEESRNAWSNIALTRRNGKTIYLLNALYLRRLRRVDLKVRCLKRRTTRTGPDQTATSSTASCEGRIKLFVRVVEPRKYISTHRVLLRKLTSKKKAEMCDQALLHHI